jgi:hypothetical protein
LLSVRTKSTDTDTVPTQQNHSPVHGANAFNARNVGEFRDGGKVSLGHPNIEGIDGCVVQFDQHIALTGRWVVNFDKGKWTMEFVELNSAHGKRFSSRGDGIEAYQPDFIPTVAIAVKRDRG